MIARWRAGVGIVCAVAFWVGLTGQPAPVSAEMPAGPLVEYVRRADPAYGWKKVRDGKVLTTSYAELRLTSQTWRGITWKHQLFVIKPSTVREDSKHALLFIAGGSWREELERADAPVKMPREANILAALAEQLRSPIAILLHVPHQPIFDGKTEDAIIAYTFEEFLKTGDSDWPLLLPMVKSAVRGMDAVQEFAKSEWSLGIESFTVTGGSKRGWTTWLTGAVEPRAVAIAPMVIDVLNMGPQMEHQVATWGEPSVMIQDYTRRGLDKQFKTKPGQQLLSIVDPFSYRERLQQPKLIILGTNDPYWPLDALNLYWQELSGPKHVLYIPNNGHGLNDVPRLAGGLQALHQHVAEGKPLPKLDWKFESEADKLALHLKIDQPTQRVNTWIATSPTRDFRKAQWTSSPARLTDNGHVCELPTPTTGYAAMFGEAVFTGANEVPYFLSTTLRIVEAKAK